MQDWERLRCKDHCARGTAANGLCHSMFSFKPLNCSSDTLRLERCCETTWRFGRLKEQSIPTFCSTKTGKSVGEGLWNTRAIQLRLNETVRVRAGPLKTWTAGIYTSRNASDIPAYIDAISPMCGWSIFSFRPCFHTQLQQTSWGTPNLCVQQARGKEHHHRAGQLPSSSLH